MVLGSILLISLSWYLFLFYRKSSQIQETVKLIDQAYLAEGTKEKDWYFLEPFSEPTAKLIIQKALESARQIVSQYSSDAELNRLLGRVALLSGRPQEAVRAFSRAADLRSDSPAILIELGNAYASLVYPSLSDIDLYRLHSLFSPQSRWQLLSAPSEKYFLSLPNASEDLAEPDLSKPVTRMVFKGDEIRILVQVPANPSELIFWTASNQATPIVYQVLTDNEEQNAHTFTLTSVSGWYPVRVDLNAWSNRSITLILKANHPEALWGDIAIAETKAVDCIVISCWQQAVAAWRKAGFTVDDMMQAGDVAFDLGQHDKAKILYFRSMLFNEHQSDILYRIGFVYETEGLLVEALEYYGKAIARDQFHSVSKGTVYFRIGEINQRKRKPPDYDLALWAYNQALDHDGCRDDKARAHCYFRIGETSWLRGEIDQAITYLEKALTLNPHHEWGNIILGMVYYAKNQDIQLSTQIMARANSKWSYYYRGELYLRAGLVDRAIEMYQKALEFDRSIEPAAERLRSLAVP